MTVLIDTSAWIEYFRGTDSSQADIIRGLAEMGEGFNTCGPVTMEVFAGAGSRSNLDTMRRILEHGSDIPVGLEHFEEAAGLYRTCRSEGYTIRSLIDCLIAVVALSEDVEILHHDRDFNVIAQVVPLRVHPASLAV